jgi:hypothetical protein
MQRSALGPDDLQTPSARSTHATVGRTVENLRSTASATADRHRRARLDEAGAARGAFLRATPTVRQRGGVAIARAIVLRPRLLVADGFASMPMFRPRRHIAAAAPPGARGQMAMVFITTTSRSSPRSGDELVMCAVVEHGPCGRSCGGPPPPRALIAAVPVPDPRWPGAAPREAVRRRHRRALAAPHRAAIRRTTLRSKNRSWEVVGPITGLPACAPRRSP